jgi:hypothetical protein
MIFAIIPHLNGDDKKEISDVWSKLETEVNTCSSVLFQEGNYTWNNVYLILFTIHQQLGRLLLLYNELYNELKTSIS